MSLPDLDHILTAIRAEAARRGGSTRIGVEATEIATSGMRLSRPALVGEPRHVRDYLPLSSERLLDVAYRRLLNRPPDPTGVAHFRRAMRTGQWTKAEVLGRIRYSAEGRAKTVAVPGLALALALALVYRVPVLGWLGALVAEVLRLPPHLRDRSRAERAAQETAAELEG
jgi:O-antigen chain-terminating methyltransferase